MTIWTNQRKSGLDDEYKERLGSEVFEFLKKDTSLRVLLIDYKITVDKLHSQMNGIGLVDNSLFVLPVCKLFEGILQLVAKETGWLEKFGKDKDEDFIRSFFKKHRAEIEKDIDTKIVSKDKRQEIKDKVFSVVNDFKVRHEAVHYGKIINTSEVANYDAIITKIKEIVSVLIENKFVDVEINIISSSD